MTTSFSFMVDQMVNHLVLEEEKKRMEMEKKCIHTLFLNI